MDRESRKRRLDRFSRNERIFPGGDHPTGNCGACARIITDRFGGKVVGYYHADNPMARVGAVEFGHDFAITEDRFLVDPWLFHYYGDTPVLDLLEPAGQAEALARYGPEENWKPLPSRDSLVKVSRVRVERHDDYRACAAHGQVRQFLHWFWLWQRIGTQSRRASNRLEIRQMLPSDFGKSRKAS
jgi:hypothetical protein